MRVRLKNGLAVRNAAACRPTVTGIAAGIVRNVTTHSVFAKNTKRKTKDGLRATFWTDPLATG